MKKHVIMLDVDGCLAEFIGGFTAFARTLFPDVPHTLGQDQPSWNGFPGMSKDMIARTWDSIKNSPSFWQNLAVLPTVADLDRIARLSDTSDVYFVTARVGREAKQQTEAWISDNLMIDYPTVIISPRKGEVAKAIGAHYCIDDKASNASTVAWLTEDKTKSYLLDRPYNRVAPDFTASSVVRVSSISEYLNAVEGVQVYA